MKTYINFGTESGGATWQVPLNDLNFPAPWPGEEERQAGALADLFIRMVEADPTVVTTMRRWMSNTFAWIVRSGLTVADSVLLLDSLDNRARQSISAMVPPSPA